MKYNVKFETDEDDIDIFKSALEVGLEKVKTKAKIIEIKENEKWYVKSVKNVKQYMELVVIFVMLENMVEL